VTNHAALSGEKRNIDPSEYHLNGLNKPIVKMPCIVNQF